MRTSVSASTSARPQVATAAAIASRSVANAIGICARCGRADVDALTLVRMRNTLDLEHLLVSESLRTAVDADQDLEITGDATPMAFDEEGRLQPWQ
jgi:hypothetical protein